MLSQAQRRKIKPREFSPSDDLQNLNNKYIDRTVVCLISSDLKFFVLGLYAYANFLTLFIQSMM